MNAIINTDVQSSDRNIKTKWEKIINISDVKSRNSDIASRGGTRNNRNTGKGHK